MMKTATLSLLIFISVLLPKLYLGQDVPDKYKHVGTTAIMGGKYAFIGDPGLTNHNLCPSAVIVFKNIGDEWYYSHTIQETRDLGNTYGKSIAHHGKRLYVGNDQYSVVYVYRESDGYKRTKAAIPCAYPLKHRNYGKALAKDDQFLYVGYVLKAQGFRSAKGRVEVLDKFGNKYDTHTNLNANVGDALGFGSVLLAKDGYLFVSSNESISHNEQGLVFVYKVDKKKVKLVQTLRAPDSRKMNGFGYGITFENNELFISEAQVPEFRKANDKFAYQRDNKFWGGKVHCYKLNEEGDFALDTTLLAPINNDPQGFGNSLAASDNTLYVASYEGVYGRGKVYLYQRDCNNNWKLKQRMQSQNSIDEKQFGFSIGAQGTELIVGAKRASYDHYREDEDPENEGAAYFYNYEKDELIIPRIKEVHSLEYKSPSGKMYYQSEQFYDTIQNKEGCDSVMLIDLTIKNKDRYILDDDGHVVKTFSVAEVVKKHPYDKRERELEGEITTSARFLELEYYDNGSFDRDHISIELNKQWYLDNELLTKEKKTITLELKDGENILEIYADDLGEEPPNTVMMKVKDLNGDVISELKLRSDLETNAFVRIMKE